MFIKTENNGHDKARGSYQRGRMEWPGVRGLSFSNFLLSRTTSASKLAMRLNLQVPPSVAVTGQAAGLCLALCLNLHPAGVLPALADDGTSGAAVCPALSSALGNPHLSLIQPHAHAHPHRQLTPTLCCAAQVKYKFPPIDRKKVGRCEFSSSAMGQAPPTAEAHHRANPRCGRGTSLEGSPVFRAP